MTNLETKHHLLKYAEKRQVGGMFSWPTDACGYDQHIKFVVHRNANWKGGDWFQFVADYANTLEDPK